MLTPAANRKPFVRQDAILAHLRREITSGRLAPGQRVPAQSEILRRFGSSPLTVERVFRKLVTQGFVRTEPRSGSFVTERPPHLRDYAIAFDSHPVRERPFEWSRFYRALVEAARQLEARSDGRRRFKIYYDVLGHRDSEGYQRLMRDVEDEVLAGIIFATPYDLIATPLMERTDPPRVQMAATMPGMPVRGVNGVEFMRRGLAALAADGRRRVALITKPDTPPQYLRAFRAGLARHGMVSLPFWTQAVEPHHPRWVRHAVHAVLHSHDDLVPDSMLVADDHLVEAVEKRWRSSACACLNKCASLATGTSAALPSSSPRADRPARFRPARVAAADG
jgi:DNA-binding transcriptional regulator YhcF (GntR family)